MRISKFWIIIGLIALAISPSRAQTVKIQDSLFANFLCEYWVGSITDDCDSLIISEANIQPMINGLMNFDHRGISIIDEAIHFNNLRQIQGIENELQIVPQLGDLVWYLDLSDNQIHSFAPDFINSNSHLHTLILKNNELKELPNASIIKKVVRLDLRENQLTFEDLLPIVQLPNFHKDSFLLQDQDSIVFTETNLQFREGDSLIYSLAIDENVESNIYSWYKDDELISETSQAILKIDSLQTDHTGQYHLVIRNSNPKLSEVRIYSKNSFEIEVVPDLALLDPEIITDCHQHTLQFSGSAFDWFITHGDLEINPLTNSNGLLISDSSIEINDSGVFHLNFVRNDSIIQTVKEWIHLPKLPVCNSDLISPYDDEIYFEEEGNITILDKTGSKVIELDGPTNWNMRNSNGELVKPGLYFLEFVNGEVRSVSILY